MTVVFKAKSTGGAFVDKHRGPSERSNQSAVNSAERLHCLRLMLEVREGDIIEGKLHRQGRGWIHIPGAGHEAIGTLGLLLVPADLVFGYYRDRALFRARGVSATEIAREHLATARSSTSGRMMPIHGSYRRLGIFPPVTPTGAQCLPATGAAWAQKLKGNRAIVLCTIGDAAVRQGEFYEALCFAVERKLPIVFVVEDNAFGISTRTSSQLPFRLGVFASEIFRFVNARDVDEVLKEGKTAIEACRAGMSPQVLWCEIDRLTSHTNSDDQRVYRSADELEAAMQRDPITTFADRLIAENALTAKALARLKADVAAEIGALYDAAAEEPDPLPDQADDFSQSPSEQHRPPIAVRNAEWTMVSAFQRVLAEALRQNPNVIVFGEDIEDPKGGVFGFTKGLSRVFPGRVVNAPLAEATIVGVGTGLAASGMRPVFELQFIDFMAPAFNQLLNQTATLRWRSNGDWTCPAIFYAPYGGYLPAGGTWHSQSNEGMWAHIPGLHIAIPSTPSDLVGLFWSALKQDEPTLFLIPKHVMRVRQIVPEFVAVPFGTARVVEVGHDVTLVTWGNGVELALEAAAELHSEISVEIIDLRTIVPCDYGTITSSLARTGRLVVVTEDARTCSFAQSVVAEICSTRHFNLLLAAPVIVARPDSHIPYHPVLESAVLPNRSDIVTAIYAVMS